MTNDGVSGTHRVDADDGEIEVGAESGTQITTSAPGDDAGTTCGSAGVPVCEWELVPEDHFVYRRRAGDDDDPTGPPVTAWERALELLVLPGPRIEVNPTEPVVHVETWLWVEGVSWEAPSDGSGRPPRRLWITQSSPRGQSRGVVLPRCREANIIDDSSAAAGLRTYARGGPPSSSSARKSPDGALRATTSTHRDARDPRDRASDVTGIGHPTGGAPR